jgi:hypothetical protein
MGVVVNEYACHCDPALFAQVSGNWRCAQCGTYFRNAVNPRRAMFARLAALEGEAKKLRDELNIAQDGEADGTLH